MSKIGGRITLTSSLCFQKNIILTKLLTTSNNGRLFQILACAKTFPTRCSIWSF